jgi:hypothetical protein
MRTDSSGVKVGAAPPRYPLTKSTNAAEEMLMLPVIPAGFGKLAQSQAPPLQAAWAFATPKAWAEPPSGATQAV